MVLRYPPSRVPRRPQPRQAPRTARPGRLLARNRIWAARLQLVRAGQVQVHRRLAAHLRHGPGAGTGSQPAAANCCSAPCSGGDACLAGPVGVPLLAARGAVPASRGWGMYAVGIGLTAACGVLFLVLRGLVLLIDAWPGDPMQQRSGNWSASHGDIRHRITR